MILPNENGSPDAPEPPKKPPPSEPEVHGPDELMDWIDEDFSGADAGWREELVQELQGAVEDLSGFPDPDEDFDPPEPPDLYTFFYELLGMRNALRKAQQDTSAEMRRQREALKRLAESSGEAAAVSQLRKLAAELRAAGQVEFAERLLALLPAPKKKS